VQQQEEDNMIGTQ